MKRITLILGTLCLGLSLSAQPGTIKTRPANDPSGKILTMEETTLSRSLTPANLWCSWQDGAHLLMNKDGKWQTYSVADGSYAEYKADRTGGLSKAGDKLPKDAANFSNGANGDVAFTSGKSLYICDNEGNIKPIAVSENDQITYGQFASRNEFGITEGIFWAPKGTKVGFYRKDESKVTTFPLLDITTRTGSLKEIKYPMAGMDSENVGLGIYDVAAGTTVYIKADDFGYDQYLTNIAWTPDDSHVLVQVLDRSQKHAKLNMYDAATGNLVKTILTEDNEKYVEPSDPVWFVKGTENIFIYRTANRDGYRNLYLCDLNGNITRLTQTDADVAYIGNDGKYVYYTSAEVSPVENHLFRKSIKVAKNHPVKGTAAVKAGNPERLTTEAGWHDISMSPDYTYFTDSWSNLTTPRVVDLCTADGKTVANLLTAEDPTLDYAYTEISLGTVKSADGKYDNYYRLIKPLNFDPAKKYPVIVYDVACL